jgi:hypothetical protein
VRHEHQAIAEAIAARDPKAAREAAFCHMHSTESRIQTAEAEFWTAERRAAANRLARTDLKAVLIPKSRLPIS